MLTGIILSGMLAAAAQAAITIDYPAEGSIFPPEIGPPAFVWRDSAAAARRWRIEISFAGGGGRIRAIAKGEHLRTGEIDPSCIAKTNQLPRLTPQQAAARTWRPDAAVWETIKKRSAAEPATVTITGLSAGGDRAVSRGRVRIRTSKDPVGAPVFYRDVPLMPTGTETGSIQPLAAAALPLVRWRLRNIGESRSRVVMEDLPVCANCHSFSADGKTMGMDLDGLQQNKGRYILAPVKPEMRVRREDVIQWSTPQGRLKGRVRIGFMSQVSPDGQYVVTTINPSQGEDPPSNYYVTNYRDYRFLQVFYPTRGILAWYSRATGVLQPLPGADDPRFVQMTGVWSPDGEYVVFARAEAQDPNPEGAPVAQYANDPRERQIRYDLYRIPFRGGKGGRPEPIAGASGNGMSNTFPKVSPDGRWIVYVQCRNGQLMRPDSELYIVPAAGGKARRMRCNTPLMNSWHSFSPNGRWLVFSSKSRSPYTQMYLTHIDEEGNDSPAILVENATAANRAVNLPEFVNLPPEGLREIGGPAIEYYRLFNSALYLQRQGRLGESVARWRQVLAISPEDALARSNLAMALLLAGRREEAGREYRTAREMKLREVVEAKPGNGAARVSLGDVLYAEGKTGEALEQWREALRLKPDDPAALGRTARVLATSPEAHFRNGSEAVALAARAVQLSGGKDAALLDTLAAAYAEAERFGEAAATARRALGLAREKNQAEQAEAIERRLALYEARRPLRENRADLSGFLGSLR